MARTRNSLETRTKLLDAARDLIRAKIEMTKQRITAPPRAIRPEELN